MAGRVDLEALAEELKAAGWEYTSIVGDGLVASPFANEIDLTVEVGASGYAYFTAQEPYYLSDNPRFWSGMDVLRKQFLGAETVTIDRDRQRRVWAFAKAAIAHNATLGGTDPDQMAATFDAVFNAANALQPGDLDDV